MSKRLRTLTAGARRFGSSVSMHIWFRESHRGSALRRHNYLRPTFSVAASKSAERGAESGFTVVELLVAIALIGLLVALLVPAVQSTREAARRAQCTSNLRQIGIAISAYESAYRMFPPGATMGASLHVVLLPQLDQQALFGRADFARADYSALQPVPLPVYCCPSETASRVFPRFNLDDAAETNYAGNAGTGVPVAGYNGMFRHLSKGWSPVYPEGPIRASDVRDGLSQTVAVSEILIATGRLDDRLRVNWRTPDSYGPDQWDAFVDVCDGIPADPVSLGWQGNPLNRGLPWTKGELGWTMYNHVLTPNRASCLIQTFVQPGIYTAASLHRGGVNVLYGDGHVSFTSNEIDRAVWRELGSRVSTDLAKTP